MADGVHHGTFVLSLAENRMDRLAHIRQRHVVNQLDLAALSIDFHFGAAPTDLPKRRRRTEGGLLGLYVLIHAAPDQLAALGKKNPMHKLFVRKSLTFESTDFPVTQRKTFRFRSERLGRVAQQLALEILRRALDRQT